MRFESHTKRVRVERSVFRISTLPSRTQCTDGGRHGCRGCGHRVARAMDLLHVSHLEEEKGGGVALPGASA